MTKSDSKNENYKMIRYRIQNLEINKERNSSSQFEYNLSTLTVIQQHSMIEMTMILVKQI